MWIFTDTGFLSAVEHRDDKSLLVVRARDRDSLLPLEDMGNEITRSSISDYPYRVIISKKAFAEWTSFMTENIDYPNFKNQVAVTRGKKFASVLSGVWARMLDAEDAEAHEMRSSYESSLGFRGQA
jgi:hypothetical protein